MKSVLFRRLALFASLTLLPMTTSTSCNSNDGGVRGVDALHTTADGRELYAKWLRQNASEKKPVLLLLHQPGSGRDRHDFDEIFDALYEAGFNLLVPDLRSHGESDAAGTTEELETDPAGYPVDVEAWLRFLVNRDVEDGEAVDSERIGVIGLGTSANLAAAAVAHGQAHCAVAVSPNLEQFNALQAGFEGAVGGDDDDSAIGDDDDSAEGGGGEVAPGVNLNTIRWIAAAGDPGASESASTLHEATADPTDLVELAGNEHGVEVLWASTENKTTIIEWCGANL
jgi:pimeloyl-ACP methyl ester carboxylesterase